ncbi:S-adenosyl-L-methionine-dependent methyltransferase [Kalaharituber pfeilii]|nr:S-adenosyl-L-methionine-dependent methyltransferase [Kalaharituber pfeilii]
MACHVLDNEQADNLVLSDDEGWESADQADQEDDSLAQCLLCPQIFPSATLVLEHCHEEHNFDLKNVRKKFDLDFYATIKLINYIRYRVVKAEDSSSDVVQDVSQDTIRSILEDEKYLQPILEDDPLLYGFEDDGDEIEAEAATGDDMPPGKRIKALEEQLERQRSEFEEYKEMVRRNFAEILKERIESATVVGESSKEDVKTVGAAGPTVNAEATRDDDTHYFSSYAGNDIHETMLKDAVRTEGYRDFIYGNKHLFKDKIVLDVGCGTGILSMFCAKAGAKKVIGVDNSDIINKARANIFENGLVDAITLLRGKIEQVTLPVQKVDIIVSEWMGYCLLYEAMLDSVLFARDKYLDPISGIMVPSHINLAISTLSDSDFFNDRVNFWNDIYGFKMSAMKEKIEEDVIVTSLSSKSLSSTPVTFCHFPLASVTVEELSFNNPFELVIDGGGDESTDTKKASREDEWREIDRLDGFVIYFDTFFLPHPAPYDSAAISANSRAETWKFYDPRSGGLGVAFTTGPYRTLTHWQQGVLLINGENAINKELEKGDKVAGTVEYRKSKVNSRELEIEMSWVVVRQDGAKGREANQLWHMR